MTAVDVGVVVVAEERQLELGRLGRRRVVTLLLLLGSGRGGGRGCDGARDGAELDVLGVLGSHEHRLERRRDGRQARHDRIARLLWLLWLIGHCLLCWCRCWFAQCVRLRTLRLSVSDFASGVVAAAAVVELVVAQVVRLARLHEAERVVDIARRWIVERELVMVVGRRWLG